MSGKSRSILKISDLTKDEIIKIMNCANEIKKTPSLFKDRCSQQTLLMLFEKPSLRTRVSFETGMTQMGGHAIFYSVADSPLGKKETISDTAKVLSRMVDVVMARLNKREDMRELALNSTIPVINALDDFAHPCQMLADLQTIIEKKGKFDNITLAYAGDLRNNVTYDLMRLGSVMGFAVNVSGPTGKGYEIEEEVLAECHTLCAVSGGVVRVFPNVADAVRGADVVYCDSWMSYGIPSSLAETRRATFLPFQINAERFALAKPDAIFMNCLPATRGDEQTADVIDGPRSVVFDQAENRLHAQKALLLFLLAKNMSGTV
uniref:ornithine carbamoyltransferase n=1 Tax=Pyrsonympha sp. LN-2016a TaxID=1812477 RepID=A0A142D9Y3_9EUKA|nr:ornithine transcarbamylase [Pyrsonympha sp. LN-2016a]